MLYYVVLALYIIVCALLLTVVLLQQGKGGGLAAGFGGASSQTAFGARAGASVLTRATTVLGTLFMLGAFALTLMGRVGGGSVVSGVDGPPPSTAPALPMPAIPAGAPGATPESAPPPGAAPTPETAPPAATPTEGGSQ